MKVIQTAVNIGQAFKNVSRVTEILGVLGSHGFADLIHRIKLSRFLSRSENPRFKEMPVETRLRLSFEELGPSFVKLGQLLASRSDLLPENFIEEFEKLQDHVATVPFEDIRKCIEAELKAPLDTLFSQFDEHPIAAASIAQVHGATLKTGERVAVKVQRPGISKTIHNDIYILRGLAVLLEKYVPEVKIFNPQGIVQEFFRAILFELDFRVEANNIKRIKANLNKLKRIVIPTVYSQFSTEKLLALERFEGIRFSNREAILRAGINPVEIIEAGAEAFFTMVMHDGLFHADLHAGNLFVLSDGRIGLIDFGIVGRLSQRVRESIITLFVALMDEDYETLANEYITLSQPTGHTDFLLLQKDLMDAISPYVGMVLGEINAGKVLLKSTAIAAKHHLIVPRELMLLFKAIVTIDALGKRLDPTFDVLQLGNRLARSVITTRYSRERIFRDILVFARDLQSGVETIPRLLKRFLRVWSHNDFAFVNRNPDVLELASAVRFMTQYAVVCVLSVSLLALGIAFLHQGIGPLVLGVPVSSWLLFISALILLGHSLFKIKRVT